MCMGNNVGTCDQKNTGAASGSSPDRVLVDCIDKWRKGNADCLRSVRGCSPITRLERVAKTDRCEVERAPFHSNSQPTNPQPTYHSNRGDQQMTSTPTDYRRREFVTLAATGVLTGCLPRCCHAGIASEYAALKTDRYLGPVEVLAKVTDAEVFTEGPAVDRAGRVHFTNVPVSKILQWNPENKKLSVFQDETQKTNGLCFDRQERLLACEGGAGRVTRTDLKTGHKEVLADQFAGKKLAAPNDLCIDSLDRIYFTSRSGTKDPDGENKKSVYRIDPNGALSQILVWPTVHMPNGIVISPDNRTLYLIEAHPDADHHRDIRAFDLLPDGSLKNGRILVNFFPGRSGDGMAIDTEGNLYVAAGLHKLRGTSETLETRPGIHVISPAGKLLGFRQTPEDTITNCTFGGPDLKTLYVTCGTLLLAIPSVLRGKAI